MISSGLLGAGVAMLAFGGQVTASRPNKYHDYEVRTSSSTCSITTSSIAASKSAKEVKAAIAQVKDYFCKGPDHMPDALNVTAHATARAYAEAYTSVYVDCKARGNASYYVYGESLAKSEASAVAQAFALAMSSAISCNKCEAAGRVTATNLKKILLKVNAGITTAIDGTAENGILARDMYDVVQNALQEVEIEAFANAYAAAYAADDTCSGSVQASTRAGDVLDPETTICALNLTAVDRSVVQDAFVRAVESASVNGCRNKPGPYTKEAEGLAIAMARAVIDLSGTCIIDGHNGRGCIDASAEITATAEALATAFARGYASSMKKCHRYDPGCHMTETYVSRKVAKVLSDVSTMARASQCKRRNFSVDKMRDEIVTKTAKVTAEVMVEAEAGYRSCSASAGGETKIHKTKKDDKAVIPNGGKGTGLKRPVRPGHPGHSMSKDTKGPHGRSHSRGNSGVQHRVRPNHRRRKNMGKL
eukprot:jgi/Ulvmu1/4719/UM020_0002.1